jgi:hypothetical protein
MASDLVCGECALEHELDEEEDEDDEYQEGQYDSQCASAAARGAGQTSGTVVDTHGLLIRSGEVGGRGALCAPPLTFSIGLRSLFHAYHPPAGMWCVASLLTVNLF